MNKEARAQAVAAGIGAGVVSAMAILTLSQSKARARAVRMEGPSSIVLKIASQAMKSPAEARSQMTALYRREGLTTAEDYTVAAYVFATSDAKEDLMLAHDLAIAGLALGSSNAKPLVARTEDRLFKKVGLGERYGTLGGKSLPLTPRHRETLGGLTASPSGAGLPLAVSL